MEDKNRALTALALGTLAFTICFACWVINAVLITDLVSHRIFAFDTAQVGWLLALPILTGAVSRVPLGILADRYGGRRVFFILMLAAALPLFLMSFADRYSHFLLASLGFGLAGGGFAVGVGYVSPWFRPERQGTALGIFGMGNAGAALTTVAAPWLLGWLTDRGADPEGWRWLPRLYALILMATAGVFFALTRERLASQASDQTLTGLLRPLASPVVWRFGLYYFLAFGAFVAGAQWLLPYSVNVYGITLAQAGLLAALFSLPSGVIRALGGWLSDHFGARTVMYGVFIGCFITCLILAIPKMNITSPGPGVSAKAAGEVSAVTPERISVGERSYGLTPPPERTPAQTDSGPQVLPSVTVWQEPLVAVGESVVKDQLLARGVTNIYYPANLWLFAALVFVFGVATGVGKGGVYKMIPEHFPAAVGAVGGMVGLLGALGGFVLPPVFGYLLEATGLWSTCWMVLAVISLVCLIELHRVVRRIMTEEAPDLAQLIERRPRTVAPLPPLPEDEFATLEDLLRRVPFFHDLTEEKLKNLVSIGGYRAAAPGETVFAEGDPGDALYVILKGSVKVHHRDAQGRDIPLNVLHAGEVFGEIALIDGEPRSASVTALTDSQLFQIGRRDFLTLLSRTPRMLADILMGLSGRIRETDRRYFESLLQRERLQAEQEIERHRAIAQMVAGVAHEINTPLGIVNQGASLITERFNPGTVKALARDEAAAETLRDAADAAALIQANIARADRLISAFKRLSVRQVSESRETVDIRELTREVVDFFRVRARQARLAIEVNDRLEGSDARWEGYPGQYSQVLLNLLDNAARYAYPEGAGGRVEVTLTAAGEGYTISVRDYGRGIPKEDLPKVFEPFFTTGRDRGGSGLGLSIVRNLVTTALQGTVRVDSALEQGTTVAVTVPKVVAPHPEPLALAEREQASLARMIP
ncbi:MAG: MFS transporter [Mycobacterium leprae]